jgi:hypothetical protein
MAFQIADVEAELTQLLPALTGKPCSTRVPNPRPKIFVQVRRSGGIANFESGDRSDVFRDKPLIDIYVWGEDESTVADIMSQIRSFLFSARHTQPFSTPVDRVVEFLGPTWFDDDLTGASRLWATYEIPTRIKEI